jgi:hypothetical protein
MKNVLNTLLHEAFETFRGSVSATGNFHLGDGKLHRALMIHLDNGADYMLRRTGAQSPNYDDPELSKLIGHSCEISGVVINGVLFVRKWKKLA